MSGVGLEVLFFQKELSNVFHGVDDVLNGYQADDHLSVTFENDFVNYLLDLLPILIEFLKSQDESSDKIIISSSSFCAFSY